MAFVLARSDRVENAWNARNERLATADEMPIVRAFAPCRDGPGYAWAGLARPAGEEKSQRELQSVPYYESVFIARQDITAAQSESLSETFAGVIAEGGGQVTKTEPWGLRSLSYRIKKNRKGHYVLMNIDAPAEAVHEMERQMRLHEDVLRFMTLRVDELEEGPSAILTRQDRDRGDRGGRGGGRDRDRGPRNDRGDRPAPAPAATEGEGESA